MHIKRWLLLVFIVAIVALAFLLRDLYTGYPSASDFDVNRDRYVAVVDHVSKMDMPESEVVYLTCNPDWNIDSIEFHDEASGTRHRIAARRLPHDRIILTLITKDLGHAGVFGYVYCSGKLISPDEIGPDTWGGSQTSIHVAADMEWWVDDALPNNWWVVSNRLQ